MKKLIPTLALICMTGCAYLSSKTYDDPQTGKPCTKVRCYTLFDSQSSLAKLSVRGETIHSNEWAVGTYVGSLNQSSSASNVVAILQAIATGVAAGLK